MYSQHTTELMAAILAQLGYDPKRPPVDISPAETAKVTGLKTSTLSVWRTTKRHKLQYRKVGARVRYPVRAVAEFLAAAEQGDAQ
jgi:ABC-type proline/glycine betaine transport system substrate-binding protein